MRTTAGAVLILAGTIALSFAIILLAANLSGFGAVILLFLALLEFMAGIEFIREPRRDPPPDADLPERSSPQRKEG